MPAARSAEQVITSHTELTPTGCLLWTGSRNGGYGKVTHSGRTWQAHRFVWTHRVGEIPAGLELDHLCRTPLCVNPDHLEPVTASENHRRQYAAITACVNGHPYDSANTYIRPGSGQRDCRMCIRDRVRAYRARRAAA